MLTAAVAAALGIWGCRGPGLLPGPHPATTREPGLDRESTKEVTAKRAGALVARDGTWCSVDDAVANATPVGRMWRCRWREAV